MTYMRKVVNVRESQASKAAAQAKERSTTPRFVSVTRSAI